MTPRSSSAPWNREPVMNASVRPHRRIRLKPALACIPLLTLWTLDLQAQTPVGVPPTWPSVHLTDISVMVGLFALISAGINKYMLKNIRAELNGFKLQLFTELDVRYVSIVSHQVHQAADQREHDTFRRDLDRMEGLIARNLEQTRPRVF